MSEVEGGASEGEIAEAEKFNEMVSEGKLTPAEMARVEKDKTPEEVEAEKNLERGKEIAMDKIDDIFQVPLVLHGTPLVNIMNLVEHGFDLTKTKTTYYENDQPNLYASVRRWQSEETFAEKRPAHVICDMDFLSKSLGPEEYGRFIKQSEPYNLQMWPEIYGKPELFKGVVINHEEDYQTEQLRGRKIRSLEGAQRWVKYKMMQLVRMWPERALPIYGRKGNLLWPQRMTHEQVKQFVAEREARKKENS